MNPTRLGFDYMDPSNVIQNHPGAYIGHVRGPVTDKKSLFDALQTALNLPNYFGRNWDALNDCLGNLSWIRENEVVLVHDELPRLGGEELLIYLNLLDGAVRFWQSRRGAEHRLVIVFPEPSRFQISKAWRDARKPS